MRKMIMKRKSFLKRFFYPFRMEHGDISSSCVKFVNCKILKPDGSPSSGYINVWINTALDEPFSWNKMDFPGWRGRLRFPAIDPDSITGDYTCYIKSHDGCLVLHDHTIIKEGATIQLETGGRIAPYWAGGEPYPCHFSIECTDTCFVEGTDYFNSFDKYAREMQYPPGPYCFSSIGYYETFLKPDFRSKLRCNKWGTLKPGQVNLIEVGWNLKGYEITCILPENMPESLKLSLNLLPERDLNQLWGGFVPFINAKFNIEADKKVAGEVEEWYFEDLPLKDGAFRFVADKDGCSLAVILSCGDDDENKKQIATVEFKKGESRKQTLDLRGVLAGRAVS